jgi:hypothetical protein
MTRLGFLSPIVILAIAAAACDRNPAQPLAAGVVLRTNATEYMVSSPPTAAFATIENGTGGAVTVRRCLIAGSPVDPVAMDLVLEKQQVGGSWQAVDVGFDCVNAGAPRADAILAPHETALVLRLISTIPASYRLRVAYGLGINATPTDTAISAPFSFR